MDEAKIACLSHEQLLAYCKGIITGPAALELEAHLLHCQTCQDRVCDLVESPVEPDWLAKIRDVDSPGIAHQFWQQLVEIPGTNPQTIPKSVGRYLVERELGHGGFGRVFLAFDQQLKRSVALKIPHLQYIKRNSNVAMMLSEAQTLASLDHPGIATAFDVGSADGIPLYLVSKLIDGCDLVHFVANNPLSSVQAAELIRQAAEALDYAHRRGAYFTTRQLELACNRIYRVTPGIRQNGNGFRVARTLAPTGRERE